MVLTVNSDYFLKQHEPVDFCNGVNHSVVFEVRTKFLNYLR
jgi:hypothetical protein